METRTRKPKVVMPEVTKALQLKSLKRKLRTSLYNVSRQRSQQQRGIQVRVRPEFWEQVVRDYRKQIEALEQS